MNKNIIEQVEDILANLNAEKESITELFQKIEPLMDKFDGDDESPKAQETYLKILTVESAGRLVQLAEKLLYELSIDNMEELNILLKKYKWEIFAMDDLDIF